MERDITKKVDCQIKIKLERAGARLPFKTHESDACFDVVAVTEEIKDGFIEYGLGFSTEIPDGWQALIYPRSFISKYDLVLCNGVAVIDADYRGEWKVRFKPVKRGYLGDWGGLYISSGNVANRYQVGDAVAQIQFQRVPIIKFLRVDVLSDTERGEGGFGSTTMLNREQFTEHLKQNGHV